uniref:29 protein n=3 Tax=Orthoherpesviridae TaxID=3044472 RepID=Q9QAI6_MHV68|nr:29 [Murid gammaherpesvirus 4]
MFIASKKSYFEAVYRSTVSSHSEEFWKSDDPVYFTQYKKQCNRLPNAYLGTLHSASKYSENFRHYVATFSNSPLDFPQSVFNERNPCEYSVPYLDSALQCSAKTLVGCSVSTTERNEYEVCKEATRCFKDAMSHKVLKVFLSNLSWFLKGHYKSKQAFLEPFQKQLILHSFMFVASIKCPETTTKLFDEFKFLLDMLYFDNTDLLTFLQKSPAFLIPRRHGKTWIVTAIISMLLTSVDDLHIGYVAHQKHVSLAVFLEISNILLAWFPRKNIDIKKENGVILYSHPGKKSSTLMCATCFNKNSIRGQTFNLLFVDEANFIKKEALPAILGFMLQKDAKIFFISSVNSGEKTTSFLYNLKDANEKMVNVVSYVCSEHMEDFNKQSAITACPCYRLYVPEFITINDNIKCTTNLLLEGSFATELMGNMQSHTEVSGNSMIHESSLTRLDFYRCDTAGQGAPTTENTLFVYIDPAYGNNVHASGTGIVAMSHCKHTKKCIILGLEHFFLNNLTGTAAHNIASCATALLEGILFQHPWIQEIRCIIEGNSNQDSAVAIATFISHNIKLPTLFASYRDKTGMQWPIYMLSGDKTLAFQNFISSLNQGLLCASQTVVSNTVLLSSDPISYLIEQIKNTKCIYHKNKTITFQSKTHTMSDDVLIACVMTCYVMTTNKISYISFSIK